MRKMANSQRFMQGTFINSNDEVYLLFLEEICSLLKCLSAIEATDSPEIQKEYCNLTEVFSKSKSKELPPHRFAQYSIAPCLLNIDSSNSYSFQHLRTYRVVINLMMLILKWKRLDILQNSLVFYCRNHWWLLMRIVNISCSWLRWQDGNYFTILSHYNLKKFVVGNTVCLMYALQTTPPVIRLKDSRFIQGNQVYLEFCHSLLCL